MTPLKLCMAFIGMVVLLAGAPAARAQRRKAVDSVQAEKDRQSQEHYKQGILHYDLGEIDAAISEFRQAYSISAAPGLLFNIAQAYRFKKDHEQSLYFYKTYLRLQPRAVNRTDVEARIAELEQLVKDSEHLVGEKPHGVIPPGRTVEDPSTGPPATATTKPPPVFATEPPAAEAVRAPAAAEAAPDQPVAVTVAPPPRPSFLASRRGKIVIGVASVGAAMLLSTVIMGGVALSLRDQFNSSCNTTCDHGLYQRAHSLGVATDVLLGFTVAAAVATLVLVLTRPREKRLGFGAHGHPFALGVTF